MNDDILRMIMDYIPFHENVQLFGSFPTLWKGFEYRSQDGYAAGYPSGEELLLQAAIYGHTELMERAIEIGDIDYDWGFREGCIRNLPYLSKRMVELGAVNDIEYLKDCQRLQLIFYEN